MLEIVFSWYLLSIKFSCFSLNQFCLVCFLYYFIRFFTTMQKNERKANKTESKLIFCPRIRFIAFICIQNWTLKIVKLQQKWSSNRYSIVHVSYLSDKNIFSKMFKFTFQGCAMCNFDNLFFFTTNFKTKCWITF